MENFVTPEEAMQATTAGIEEAVNARVRGFTEIVAAQQATIVTLIDMLASLGVIQKAATAAHFRATAAALPPNAPVATRNSLEQVAVFLVGRKLQ